jgi:hypothetical protein
MPFSSKNAAEEKRDFSDSAIDHHSSFDLTPCLIRQAKPTAVPCSNSDKTQNFIWLTPTVNFSSYPDSAFPRFLNFPSPKPNFLLQRHSFPATIHPHALTYLPNRICSGG